MTPPTSSAPRDAAAPVPAADDPRGAAHGAQRTTGDSHGAAGDWQGAGGKSHGQDGGADAEADGDAHGAGGNSREADAGAGAAARRASDRRLRWLLMGTLLVSYAYFYQAGGWNEASRFDLTRALVERHTLAIDAFAVNTQDKASFGGHYYSDKAPGLSLLAVPVYALVRVLRPLVGSDHDFVVLASYLTTVLTVGVAGAVLGGLLYQAGRWLGASSRGALLGALALGLGTTAFPFSTLFFGHQLAALLLFGSFLLAWRARRRDDPGDDSRAHSRGHSRDTPRNRPRDALVAGLLGAAAVLTELPTAPAVLLIGLYLASGSPSDGLPSGGIPSNDTVAKRGASTRLGSSGWRLDRHTRLLMAGALGPCLVLLGYLALAFGSPWQLGYGLLANASARDEMTSRGVFGLTYPHLNVLVELLLGRFRGLLPYSPVLVMSLVGFGSGWRSNSMGDTTRETPGAPTGNTTGDTTGDTSGESVGEPITTRAGSDEARRRRGTAHDAGPQTRGIRRELRLALGVVAAYLCLVSSYAWWQGGSSFGSRHLVPMLPFLALPLGLAADLRPRATTALLAVSIAIMTVVTAVQPKPGTQTTNPFWRGLLPAFQHDRVAVYANVCPDTGEQRAPGHRPFLRGAAHDAFNLGMVAGLRGRASLLPLVGVWAVAALLAARELRRAGA